MKVIIFGKQFKKSFHKYLKIFFDTIEAYDYELIIYKPFLKYIEKNTNVKPKIKKTFTKVLSSKKKVDLVFSIGGDGTFLECVSFVWQTNAPIVGINSGRLGFLANISKENIESALLSIKNKKYTIEERSLLKIESETSIFKNFNYALNDFTIQKRDTGSMITIEVFFDGTYLNTYWADGLIIATATGSTAYSLSAGGPIVVPESNNFIITPIAPHNLTIRPIVLSDNKTLTLKVKSRSENFLASLDYRSEILDTSVEISINSANFKVKTIKIENITFFDTLRNKLLWGLDSRN